MLAGVDDSRQIVRCVCAAGHKAMYSPAWGGLPPKAFLTLFSGGNAGKMPVKLD